MIPLAIPNIAPDGAEARNLQDCITHNFVSTVGQYVTDFERQVAELSGCDGGAAVGSGTQGLHIALRTLGVGRDDLVIVPSFTFIASANSISHAGAVPWFVDIEASSWTLDPIRLEAALDGFAEERGDAFFHKLSGQRIAAIMPVYTLGTAADMDAINAVAKRYRLPVIADAAAAIGVTYRNRPIGTAADLTVYSFNGNKTITSGGGGMIVGSEDLTYRSRHLSSTARVGRDYDHDAIGFNYRMTNIEAAVGCGQLERLDEFLEAKARIREKYNDAIATMDGVAPFPKPDDRESAYWFSGLVLTDDEPPEVNDICDLLRAKGVEARPFWKPVHLQPCYAHAIAGELPVTLSLWHRILTLPCSTSLTADEQEQVIAALRDIL